jgi:hypothetical protein
MLFNFKLEKKKLISDADTDRDLDPYVQINQDLI